MLGLRYKEINSWAFIQGNTVLYYKLLSDMYTMTVECKCKYSVIIGNNCGWPIVSDIIV